MGLHLASRLLDEGHAVTLLARDAARVTDAVDQGARFIEGDALDEAAIQSAVDAAVAAVPKA